MRKVNQNRVGSSSDMLWGEEPLLMCLEKGTGKSFEKNKDVEDICDKYQMFLNI